MFVKTFDFVKIHCIEKAISFLINNMQIARNEIMISSLNERFFSSSITTKLLQ